jgi:hypothetical protein
VTKKKEEEEEEEEDGKKKKTCAEGKEEIVKVDGGVREGGK